jgi:predicted AAA+ superfamily ATPase
MDRDANDDQHSGNWNRYISNVPSRNKHMYNLINYNQFTNDEIRNLENKIITLKEDKEDDRKKYNKLLDKYESLSDDNVILNMKYNQLKNREEKRNEKLSTKRQRDDTKWISSEKRKKPKTYINLEPEIKEEDLTKLFLNIKTIDDIINLKNERNKYDYFTNTKFTKLYKLIPSLEELNGLIGMDNIKKDIFNTICFFIHGLNNTDDLNHVVITGDPGVGKTSLAKLISKIYLSLGFLDSNKFIIARRSDLIAGYLGQTAIKTQKMIDEAEGGVLFIDEVYSLGNDEKRDSFAKECIDTINQNLTEKCDKFLCIIAGYKEDVNKCFFNYNKGLERRFTIKYDIEKYTSTDLSKMLLKFIKDDNWDIKFDPEKLISKNLELLKYQGGDLKTLVKNAKQEYSIRLMNKYSTDDSGDKILIKEDFDLSINKIKNQRKHEKLPEHLTHFYV